MGAQKSNSLQKRVWYVPKITKNYFVFVIGITTGLIEIDGARKVKTLYLMQWDEWTSNW